MFASFFGVGFIPFASGTFGSLASFLLIVPVVEIYGVSGLLWIVAISFILGVIATKKVLQYTEHDPSLVVIDEVCGQAICCIPSVLVLAYAKTDISGMCLFYGIAFLLFRLFDITKPLFIGVVDRKMENAVGVMLDDVLAGICGAIVWGILFFTFIYISFSGPFFQ